MVKIGMFLGDRYEILEKIGSGGMSDVYRAKDHRLNRDVAVKVLKQEFNADKSFVSKFRTEAHAAACLSHPNIVHVFDVGDSDDLHYIVMELVEGITLKTYIAKKGKLEIRETIGIAMQVAQGIEAAHEQHIVHRDIKPQNIIISRDGKVKVTDFGIAKAATSETITSNTMGSVHYISPEQARGGYCDERSDIYSLGITMYEMLTGRVPFEGDSAVSVALLHIQGEMVPPRKYNPMIPVSLEKIVLKCTQKRPEMRYRSVTELISDLKRALMTPNEDFVRMNTINSNGPTRVMSEDEVNQIRNGAAAGAMAGAGYGEAQAEGSEDGYQDGYEDGYRGDYEDGYDGSYDDPDEEERYQLDYDDDEYLPDEDDDEPVNKKSDKVYTIVGIVVAVVIVLLALFVLGKTFGFFDFGSGKKNTESMAESDGTEVAMPSLLGKTVSEAEELLKQYDLELKLSYSESKDYEDGQIMEQEFNEGDMVKRHTVVKVTVSKGTTKTTIPDNLIGMTKEQATKALHEADLNPVFDEIYSDTVDEGKVAKISPSLGSEVEIGSDVKLFISKGPETKTVDVPNLLGKSESAAKQLLASANLSVGSITEDYSDEYAEGEVMSQSPGRGQTVEENTSVDFVVSKGKKDETVPVPDITGMSEANAIARIQSAGLSYRTDRVYSNSTSAGLVDDVYPAAGTKLTKGSTVEIYISRGPRATEAPTTAPTEAPTESTAPSSEGGENLPDQPAQ